MEEATYTYVDLEKCDALWGNTAAVILPSGPSNLQSSTRNN
jgi:hypothetical protein